MSAEQLAPYLEPPAGPEEWEELSAAPGSWREDWVLPALLQFGGEVEVSDEGDLLYSFPELMLTAAEPAAPPLPPGIEGSEVGLRRGDAGSADSGEALTRGVASAKAAMVWEETPPGWVPKPGDAVRVTSLLTGEPARWISRPTPRSWFGRKGARTAEAEAAMAEEMNRLLLGRVGA